MRHVDELCRGIGNRQAGTPGEKKAADYIEAQFRSYKLRNVRREEFPCLAWQCGQAELAVKDSKWRDVPCLPVAHTSSTGQDPVEAPLLYLERAAASDLEGKDLRGKIGLVFGLLGEDPDQHRRLLSSGLAGLVFVDDRFQTDTLHAVGMARHWVDMGTLPSVSVSYPQAWEIVRRGLQRARLSVLAGQFESKSQNVVAEIGESVGDGPAVVVCAHHDSVIGSVGAEDNASGVACLLEVARRLARVKPRRTIRFVTFGTEEQLSEGAKHYVLAHRAELGQVRLVLNVDSVASWMGEHQVWVTGVNELARYASGMAKRGQFSATVRRELCPYSDHFPFNLLGIPSLWFNRRNTPTSRWFHHSVDDEPSVLSPRKLVECAEVVYTLISHLADCRSWPFPRKIPPSASAEIRRLARGLYGITP